MCVTRRKAYTNMKIRDIKYLTGEGIKNIWLNGVMSIASIGTVIACLTILGVFILFSLNVSSFADQIRAQNEILLVVDEKFSEENLSALEDSIKAVENVEGLEFISKENALTELKSMINDDDIFLGLDENPLRNTYEVSLKDLSLSAQTADALSKIEGVAKVKNNKDLTDKIIKITDILKIASFAVLLLLVIMAVLIISNTVKIGMFARRKEINIMKFIGATDRFIRFPFMVEGVTIGLVGSVFSFFLVYFTYNYLYKAYIAKFAYFLNLIPAREAAAYLVALFLCVGVVMGYIGSFLSIRKHLKV